MNGTEYNGWTNYETWLANLWIYEGTLGDPMGVEEQARYYAENGEDSAAYKMGQWIKEQVEELEGSPSPEGMVADLYGAALSRVNWTEIGRHFTDEAIENERQQTENANAEEVAR